MERLIPKIVILGALLLPLGCENTSSNQNGKAPTEGIAHDFSTPEGAILCIEDAYRAKDIEAAVKCKDFYLEGRLMLEKLNVLPKEQIDDELIKKTAEVLELGYRAELKEKGFPDLVGSTATFPKKEPYLEKQNVVVVTEVTRRRDGSVFRERVLVGKTDKGWRVLNGLDEAN